MSEQYYKQKTHTDGDGGHYYYVPVDIGWVRTSDALPEKSEMYLVLDKSGCRRWMEFHHGEFWGGDIIRTEMLAQWLKAPEPLSMEDEKDEQGRPVTYWGGKQAEQKPEAPSYDEEWWETYGDFHVEGWGTEAIYQKTKERLIAELGLDAK